MLLQSCMKRKPLVVNREALDEGSTDNNGMTCFQQEDELCVFEHQERHFPASLVQVNQEKVKETSQKLDHPFTLTAR